MNLITNQTKQELIKATNFIIGQWNHDQKKMVQKCIQYIMKENLSLLKDSLEKKKKFIATWLKLEKNFYIDKLMILMIQLINIIIQNKTSLRKIKHIC